MNCEDLNDRVDDVLDDRLDEDTSRAVAAHLEGCAACRDLVRRARVVEARLRELRDEPVPDGLLARIRESSRTPAAPRGRVARPRLAIAASVLLVVGTALAILVPRGGDITAITVNEMRTFETAARSLDVIGEDPGTLRRWFEGKVGFEPPPPPATSRLALVGARLCNLDDKRVIAYMYRDGQRYVSLYVMAGSGEPEMPPGEVVEVDGYGHLGWSDGSMRYSLVARLPEARLRALAEAFRQPA